MLALVGTVMSRSASGNVLLRDGDGVLGTHMTAGRVRVDGELVTDLDAPASAGTRVVVWGE